MLYFIYFIGCLTSSGREDLNLNKMKDKRQNSKAISRLEFEEFTCVFSWKMRTQAAGRRRGHVLNVCCAGEAGDKGKLTHLQVDWGWSL